MTIRVFKKTKNHKVKPKFLIKDESLKTDLNLETKEKNLFFFWFRENSFEVINAILYYTNSVDQ